MLKDDGCNSSSSSSSRGSTTSGCEGNESNHKDAEVVAGTPRPFDVLMGRGLKFQCHPGNTLYTGLVNSHREQYFSTISQIEKKTIIEEIVNQILEKGQFLKRENGKQSNGGGGWVPVTKERALLKTAHAIQYCQRKMVQPRAAAAAAAAAAQASNQPHDEEPNMFIAKNDTLSPLALFLATQHERLLMAMGFTSNGTNGQLFYQDTDTSGNEPVLQAAQPAFQTAASKKSAGTVGNTGSPHPAAMPRWNTSDRTSSFPLPRFEVPQDHQAPAIAGPASLAAESKKSAADVGNNPLLAAMLHWETLENRTTASLPLARFEAPQGHDVPDVAKPASLPKKRKKSAAGAGISPHATAMPRWDTLENRTTASLPLTRFEAPQDHHVPDVAKPASRATESKKRAGGVGIGSHLAAMPRGDTSENRTATPLPLARSEAPSGHHVPVVAKPKSQATKSKKSAGHRAAMPRGDMSEHRAASFPLALSEAPSGHHVPDVTKPRSVATESKKNAGGVGIGSHLEVMPRRDTSEHRASSFPLARSEAPQDHHVSVVAKPASQAKKSKKGAGDVGISPHVGVLPRWDTSDRTASFPLPSFEAPQSHPVPAAIQLDSFCKTWDRINCVCDAMDDTPEDRDAFVKELFARTLGRPIGGPRLATMDEE